MMLYERKLFYILMNKSINLMKKKRLNYLFGAYVWLRRERKWMEGYKYGYYIKKKNEYFSGHLNELFYSLFPSIQ
ncbi:hypothetical protein Tsubulata_030390 [Turnera subulata]|uniref:Uncharacterized protein n=1 Tax=Turnera subulata TaxID=218843 RepID=A0A9Q0GI10_9ROSI|nr:hypothetical protein Tsubulata_030390 [Turnera subulata]